MALEKMVQDGKLAEMPEILPVAAVSVGIVDGRAVLDLDYREDSGAEVDTNFVMAGDGRWIEVQATAEGEPFEPEQFVEMSRLAHKGIRELLKYWQS
jgi:ribonuclease PH